MDCVFCKIIEGTIPNYTLYEDEHVLAFLDIHPCAEGHTVVIPKKHGETVFELDTVTMQHVMVGIEASMKKLKDTLNPDGFSVGWNHGKAGGQAVPHLHVHIIPRWNADGGGSMHSIVRSKNMKDVGEIAKLFKH